MNGPIGLKTLDTAYGFLELFGDSREVLNGDLPFKEVFLLILANWNSQVDSSKVPLLPSEFPPLDGEENLKTKLGVMFGESEPGLIFREIEKMDTWEKISEQIFLPEDRRESLKEDLDAYRAIALAYFHFLQERLGIEDYQPIRANLITSEIINFSPSQERVNGLLKILREELLQRLSESKEREFYITLEPGLMAESDIINKVASEKKITLLNEASLIGKNSLFEKPLSKGSESSKSDISDILSNVNKLRVESLEMKSLEVESLKIESLNTKDISNRETPFQDELSNLESLLKRVEKEFENLLQKSSPKDSQISGYVEERDSVLKEREDHEITVKSEGIAKKLRVEETSIDKEFENLPLELREAFKRELKALMREIGGMPLEQGLIDHVKAMGPRIREVAPEGLEERIIHRVSLDHLSNFIKDFSTELFPTGEKRARIQLEPPELGKMELEVKVLDKEVEIRARVEKPETFAQLQQDLAQLKSQLEELGLRLKEFELLFGFAEGKGYAEERRRKEERESFTSKESSNLIEQDFPINHTGRLYKIV